MLTDGNHKPGSVKMGYYALHFLFTNIYHKDWAKEYLPTPKVAQTLPLVLSKDEVSDVLGAIPNFKHRAIIMLIYSTGARVSESVKIKKPYTPHTFRHCFATHHLEQGTNLLVIQRLMGHSDLRNTLKYLHVQQLNTKNVVNPLDTLDGLEGLCKNK